MPTRTDHNADKTQGGMAGPTSATTSPVSLHAGPGSPGLRRQVVEIVGHVVAGDEPKQHLEYIIMTQIGCNSDSAVCLVQRRFRDFDMCYWGLLPIAQEARILLPPLPSKLWGGGLLYAAKDVSPAFAAQRQASLQRWIGLVTAQPPLWCETLRRFLGLTSPREGSDSGATSDGRAGQWLDVSDGGGERRPWMSPRSLARRVLASYGSSAVRTTANEGSQGNRGDHGSSSSETVASDGRRVAGGGDNGDNSDSGGGRFSLPRGQTEEPHSAATTPSVTCLHVANEAWRAALIFPEGPAPGQAEGEAEGTAQGPATLLPASRGLSLASPAAADGSALIVGWKAHSRGSSTISAPLAAPSPAAPSAPGHPTAAAAATPTGVQPAAKHHRRALSEPPPADMLQAMRRHIQPPLPPPATSPPSSQPTSPNARSPSPSKRSGCDDERLGSGGRSASGRPPHIVAGSPGSSSIPSSAAVGFRLEPSLRAFSCSLHASTLFGPLMSLAVNNDEANLRKLKQAWDRMSESGWLAASTQQGTTQGTTQGAQQGAQQGADDAQASEEHEPCALRMLLEAECASGLHTRGSRVLCDPSAALSLVWLCRSMRFALATLAGIIAGDRTAPLVGIARAAYKAELEPHQTFWLKQTFRAGLSAMPSRNDFLGRLAPFATDRATRDATCYADLEAYVELLSRALDAVASILASLDLDDQRKA